MVRLVPMSEADYDAYLQDAIPHYAAEHVRAGNWHPSEALQKAEKEIRQLLPDGVITKDQHLLSIVDEALGATVGLLWFAVYDAAAHPRAFVYDLRIDEPYRRRGYGSQALLALQEKARELGLDTISLHVFAHNQAARALYDKVGYEVTGTYMAKKVGT